MNTSSLLIVIPTYNEKNTLGSIVQAIHKTTLRNPPDLLIVDDNSPDGTGQIAEELHRERPNVHVLHRPEKQGLGRAYIDGFRWGLSRSYSWIMEMDADFSHDPVYLTTIEQLIQENRWDVLIGSRYISGGGTKNWGWHRRLISRFGSLYSRLILGCPIHDLTGGFNVWKADVLRAINLESILSNGYAFQIELKYKAWLKGFKLHEFPITFVDRMVGQSKMSQRIAWEAMVNIIRLRQ